MDEMIGFIFIIIAIVLWFVLGVIIIKRKVREILSNINFNFRCVCDKCGEKFVRQTEYIQKNFLDKAKRKSKIYNYGKNIVSIPVYEKYAREIECPNCKEKGQVRIENLDDWFYKISPLSKNPFGIYASVLMLSTIAFGCFLICMYISTF